MGKDRDAWEKDRVIVSRKSSDNISVRRSGYDFQVRVRRLRTNPANKREEFLDRLDAVSTKVQDILDNPHSSKATKIKAANSIANIVRASYTIVRDIDIEEIEREIEELNKKLENEKQIGKLLDIAEKERPTKVDFAPPEIKKEGSNYTATGSQ